MLDRAFAGMLWQKKYPLELIGLVATLHGLPEDVWETGLVKMFAASCGATKPSASKFRRIWSLAVKEGFVRPRRDMVNGRPVARWDLVDIDEAISLGLEAEERLQDAQKQA